MPERFMLHEQQMVADFQVGVTGENPPIRDMVNQVCQEHVEMCELIDGMTEADLQDAAKDPELSRAIAMESVDQIIANLGLLSTLNQDFGVLFYQKIAIMIDKYPSGLIREIMTERGFNRQEAMAEAKGMYGEREIYIG